MEQAANFHDAAEYLCGICPAKFSDESTLIRHLSKHVVLHGPAHAHSLWCQLCSPLLRCSDVHADDQHSDLDEADYPRNVDRDHRNSVDRDYSHRLHDGHYFYSRVNEVCDDSMFPINSEFRDNSLNVIYTRIKDEFYDCTDFFTYFNDNRFNDRGFVNTSTAPPDSFIQTNDSCTSLSINVNPFSVSSTVIFPVHAPGPLQTTTNASPALIPPYYPLIQANANAGVISAGDASQVGPPIEATNAEIFRPEDITYIEPNHTENALDDSHSSECKSTELQADASNSDTPRIGPNTRTHPDTMNCNSRQSGERGNGPESAFSVNCLPSVPDANGNTSSLSSEDSKENESYAAVVKRGLSPKH